MRLRKDITPEIRLRDLKDNHLHLKHPSSQTCERKMYISVYICMCVHRREENA